MTFSQFWFWEKNPGFLLFYYLNMLLNHLNNNKYISFNKEQNWVFLFHKIVLIYKLIVMNIIQLNYLFKHRRCSNSRKISSITHQIVMSPLQTSFWLARLAQESPAFLTLPTLYLAGKWPARPEADVLNTVSLQW